MYIETIVFVKDGEEQSEKFIVITEEMLDHLLRIYVKENHPHLVLEDWMVSKVSLD